VQPVTQFQVLCVHSMLLCSLIMHPLAAKQAIVAEFRLPDFFTAVEVNFKRGAVFVGVDEIELLCGGCLPLVLLGLGLCCLTSLLHLFGKRVLCGICAGGVDPLCAVEAFHRAAGVAPTDAELEAYRGAPLMPLRLAERVDSLFCHLVGHILSFTCMMVQT